MTVYINGVAILDASQITSGILALTRLSGLTKDQLDAAAGLLLTQMENAVCSETEALAIAKGARDYPMRVGRTTDLWVLPGWYSEAIFNRSMSVNRIYYIPIFVEQDTTYDRIAINVQSAGTGLADLRIFTCVNGQPVDLILSAGTVDTGTTGSKEINISQLLVRGYYFLAVRCTGSPTLVGLDPASAISTPVSVAVFQTQSVLGTIILALLAAYTDPATAPDIAYDAKYAVVRLRES